ncbi:MAG: hypothetical protein ACJZ7Z_01865 [Myxococcota bacterium]
MSSHELYRDDYYLVEAYGEMGHATSVVGFSWRDGSFDPLRPKDFSRSFLNEGMARWPVEANWISIITSRNCWYLHDQVEPAIEVIARAVEGTRTITCGSSMGGYAAINWGKALESDYAFAISPLATLFDPFMAAIRDVRFPLDRRLLPQERDSVLRGDQSELRGLIAFDDLDSRDIQHAAAIMENTKVEALRVPRAGHPCGGALRRVYPLRRILESIIRDSFDTVAVQQEVLEKLALENGDPA